MVDYKTYKKNVLNFLERCYPSIGVFDSEAWEASGENSINSEGSRKFIRPEKERVIIKKTFEDRKADGDWAFASTPGGCESLEGGHSALETYFFLGRLKELDVSHKNAWIDYFNQYQDKDTGYYLGPYIPPKDHRSWKDQTVNTHPWRHMHDHLTCCLCPSLMLLNGKSRYKLSEGSMTGRFLDRKVLEEYLSGRDWNYYQNNLNFNRHNPWWMGNEFWYPACLLWQISQWEEGGAAKTARSLIDQVWYGWHDENFGKTGFWYGEKFGPKERLWHGSLPVGSEPDNYSTEEEWHWHSIPIMGGAHQLWFYDFDNHSIPEEVRKRQTDSVLSLQNVNDKAFGLGSPYKPASGSSNCTDVDCMTILAMNYSKQDYKREQIVAVLKDAAISILNNKLNNSGVLESNKEISFSHNFNAYETFSPAGWGNVLNQSFYFWALVSAFSVLKSCGYSDPQLDSYLKEDWPQTPSHWLWVPKK